MKRPTLLSTAALLAALVAGCASNNKPDEQPKLLGGAADSNINRPAFVEKDPPLTSQTHFAAGQFAEAQPNVRVLVERALLLCMALGGFRKQHLAIPADDRECRIVKGSGESDVVSVH